MTLDHLLDTALTSHHGHRRLGDESRVEVAEGRVHRLEAVSLGLFDDADGLVQVSGQSVSAGQRVVVPVT